MVPTKVNAFSTVLLYFIFIFVVLLEQMYKGTKYHCTTSVRTYGLNISILVYFCMVLKIIFTNILEIIHFKQQIPNILVTQPFLRF